MLSLFRCSLVTLILLEGFVVAQGIYVSEETPKLVVQCKEKGQETKSDASLRLKASSYMATDKVVGEYFHNDPNGYDPYLKIPYYFKVPGLRGASHRKSIYPGGGWRIGYLTIVIYQIATWDENGELSGFRYSMSKYPNEEYDECSHIDEDGHSSTSTNFFKLIYN